MEIELGRIVRATKRFWWVVASSVLVFALVGALMGSLLPQSYSAGSTVIVLPSTVSGATLSESGTPIQTYIELIESDSVLTPVVQEFNLDLSLEEFRSKITVSNIPGTTLIRVEVTDTDPRRAAELANAVTETFSARAESLVGGVLQTKRDDLVYERDQINSQLATINSRIEQLSSGDAELASEDKAELEQQRSEKLRLEQRRADLNGNIRIIENTILNTQAPITVSEVAVPPDESEGLSAVLLIAVAGVLGALVGSGVMLWLELRDPYVRDEQHVRELLGIESVNRILGNVELGNNHASLKLAAARITGLARNADTSSVVFASPRENEQLRTVADAIHTVEPIANMNVAKWYGLLDTGEGLDSNVNGSPAMLFIEASTTKSADVQEVASVLMDLGVSSVSATILDS